MPILDLLKYWCITMKSLFLFTFKLEKQWNRGNGALIEKKIINQGATWWTNDTYT